MPPNLYQREKSIPLMKILKIEQPLEGGLLSYVEGMEVPYKGFPEPNIVYALGTVKKAIKNLMSIHLKYKILFLLFILPNYRKTTLSLFNDFCEGAIHYLTTPIEGYPENPNKWCKSARELWRAGAKNYIWKVVCLIWEFDNAYRFRGQFIFKLLNKEQLLLSTKQELLKVLKEMQDREANQPMKDKYKMLFKLTYLLYIPSIKKSFIEFVNNLDFGEIKPDKNDMMWLSLGKSFNFK